MDISPPKVKLIDEDFTNYYYSRGRSSKKASLEDAEEWKARNMPEYILGA